MRLTIQDDVPARSGDYYVHFDYSNVMLDIHIRGHAVSIPTVQTSCIVHYGKCVRVEGEGCVTPNASVGFTKLSPRDAFCRHVGRKKAFERAIQGFPTEIRSKLWAAFFTVWPPTPTKPGHRHHRVSPPPANEVTNATKPVGSIPDRHAA